MDLSDCSTITVLYMSSQDFKLICYCVIFLLLCQLQRSHFRYVISYLNWFCGMLRYYVVLCFTNICFLGFTIGCKWILKFSAEWTCWYFGKRVSDAKDSPQSTSPEKVPNGPLQPFANGINKEPLVTLIHKNFQLTKLIILYVIASILIQLSSS
jgi:hypothetical protein